MPEISILLIGDLNRPEFEGAGEFFSSFGLLHFFSGTNEACKALADGEIFADMVIIASAYPGQFSQEEIDRLREMTPVSRFFALAGTWCEGEMRSGQPWPAVIRQYWHQGLDRFRREIERLINGDCPSWGLPITATEEERLLTAIPPSRTGFQQSGTGFQPVETDGETVPTQKTGWKPVPQRGLIGISAVRYDSFDWLSSACRMQDHATIWLRGPHYPLIDGLQTILADGTDFRGVEFETFLAISARYPRTKRIALMDFPRVEDRRRLLEAGAAAVLSKPVIVEDLLAELGQF
jgi:CheY-like chemotaxis protein